MREAAKRSSASMATSHISRRASPPGSSSISRCGGRPIGTNWTCSSSSCTSASWAHTRWPMCGGLNAAPRMPTRKPALLADLALALDHVLVGGELTQPDRPPGVELLGGVADLRPHAEHGSVGEARGRVHVHAGGVDALAEGTRRAGRA